MVGLQAAKYNSFDAEAKFVGSPVQVIAVTGGKGGIGKSAVSVNLAISLAQEGRKVMLMDADLGMANVNVLLGLEVRHNLSHVINAEKELVDVIIDGPCGIKIVPAASGISRMAQLSVVENASIISAFNSLPYDIDTLVIDTAAGLSGSMLSFARASREIVVVVCDEPTSITDAYATIKVLNQEYGIHRFRVVTNKIDSSRHGLELYNKLVRVADKYLDVLLDFSGGIPMDEHLQKSVYEQAALVVAYPRSRSALAFKKLAARVERWPRPQDPDGHLEFFVERLINYSEHAG